MFLGQYSHSLDDKGRLTIPSAYRDPLADGAYISQGFDKNLMVMTSAYFQTIYDRLNAMNIVDPSARSLKRMFLSSSFKVDLDKAGRIVVPPNLREFIGTENELNLIGQGAYFEIWTPGEWAKQSESLEDVEQNATRFAALDLSAK